MKSYKPFIVSLLGIALFFIPKCNCAGHEEINSRSTPRIIMHGGISLYPNRSSIHHAIIDNATFVLSGNRCKTEALRVPLVLRNVTHNIAKAAFASMIELHDSICASNATVEGYYHIPGSSLSSISFSVPVPLETLLKETIQTESLQLGANYSVKRLPVKIDSIARITGRSVSYKKFDLTFILPTETIESTSKEAYIVDFTAPATSITTKEKNNNTAPLLSQSPLMQTILNQTRLSLASTFLGVTSILNAEKRRDIVTTITWIALITVLLISIDKVCQLQSNLEDNGIQHFRQDNLSSGKKKSGTPSSAMHTPTTASKVPHHSTSQVSRSETQHSSPSRLSSADYDLFRKNPTTNSSTKLSSFTVKSKGEAEQHMADSYKSMMGQGDDGTLYAVRTQKRSSKRKSQAPSPSRAHSSGAGVTFA